jgi:hypothetical protein
LIELYHQQKDTVWRASVAGADVTIEHGKKNGKMQQTGRTCEPKHVGKSNEKSGAQVAEEYVKRQVLLKKRGGYTEANGESSETMATEIDFNEIPLNARFWKPTNNISKHMEELIEAGKAWWTRKLDGRMHSILCDNDGQLHMYSSTMQPAHKDEPDIPWLARYPHLEADLESLEIPPRTILLGDLIVPVSTDDHGFYVEDLETVGRVVGAKYEKSLVTQEEVGPAHFAMWGIPFWNGAEWGRLSRTQDRLRYIHKLIKEMTPTFITHPEILYMDNGKAVCLRPTGSADDINFNGTKKDALAIVKALEWEGFVAVDPDATFGDKFLSFRGRAERPKYACKVKPKFEADFIARFDPENGHGHYGQGKRSEGIGAVALFLLNEAGEEVFISDLGGGLTDEQLNEWADPSMYPAVWAVEFSLWTAKDAIRHGNFLRWRNIEEGDSKPSDECTFEQVAELRK